MTWTQYAVIFVMVSVASFIASRSVIWYVLTRWFSHLEQWEIEEVFVNCGALGFGLAFALSLMLFLDGFKFIIVSLSIVCGYLIWPFLLFTMVTLAFYVEWAVRKLDNYLRRIFGKSNE